MRLGVEWARIQPTERDFDDDATEYYVAIVADLQSRGLKVCLTLNHWVVPQRFAATGGWLGDNAIESWERFVRKIVPAVAPHVDLWITLNEPGVPVIAGYLGAHHPPNEANPLHAAKAFARLLEAHAIAYRVVHELVPRSPSGEPTQVGYASAYQHVEPSHEHGWRRPFEKVISRGYRWIGFVAWDHSILTGRVPFPAGFGRRIASLKDSYDFVGVNYYTRVSIKISRKFMSNVKAGDYDAPPGIEKTSMGWQVYPPGFHKVLADVSDRMSCPIYITENGCCEDGDEMRRRYLISHLSQVHRAIADGVDVRGYMVWTFMDNFEWREGFAKRFGIVEMDPTDPDLTRKPRPSAYLMQAIAKANALTPEIVEQYGTKWSNLR